MRHLLILAMLLAAAPAWSALYKWVDEAGRVHYSDQPPPGTAKNKQTIEVSRPAPSAAPRTGDSAPKAAAKSPAELEMEFRKRQTEASEAEAKKQKDAQANSEKQRNCTDAKNRVAALEKGGRITKYGPGGEQQYLSDEEIGKELVQARKTADSWCN